MHSDKLWSSTVGNLAAKHEIILFHGWGLHSDVWMPLVEVIKSEFRITMIDLPGHGRSAHILWDQDINKLLEQIVTCCVDGAVLVGWSLGGLIATLLSRTYPEKCKALITIASNPCFVERPQWPHAMPLPIFDQFQASLNVDPKQLLGHFCGLVAKGDIDEKKINKSLKSMIFRYSDPSVVSLSKALYLLRETDLRQILQISKQPIFHLFSEFDALVPSAVYQERCFAFGHQQVELIKKACHIPFYGYPEKVGILIADFYNKAIKND